MKLDQLLSEKKPGIVKKWFEVILDAYPPDTSTFLKRQDNPFTNPVGSTIQQGIESIFDGLTRGMDIDRVSPFLDNIIRIRAVQDFTPSQAVSFIFSLKSVIWKELEQEIRQYQLYEDFRVVEAKIDDLGFLCFDIFVKCREKIYDIKANEVRRMTFRLLQRANMLGEDRDEEPGHATDMSDKTSNNK